MGDSIISSVFVVVFDAVVIADRHGNLLLECFVFYGSINLFPHHLRERDGSRINVELRFLVPSVNGFAMVKMASIF